jgi:hypothetical protein
MGFNSGIKGLIIEKKIAGVFYIDFMSPLLIQTGLYYVRVSVQFLSQIEHRSN